MSALKRRLQRRFPRWVRLELRAERAPRIRLLLPLEPFETPLAFVLALARWWFRRRLGERGAWRALFDPPRLGLDTLRPDEPLLEVRTPHAYVLVRIGGWL